MSELTRESAEKGTTRMAKRIKTITRKLKTRETMIRTTRGLMGT